MHQLKRAKRSALVLTRAVALCSELFARSVAFRALVATNASALYASLLEAAGEQHNASAHMVRASRAQQSSNAGLQLVLTMVESWKDAFGDKYPPVAAGYAALQQKGYVFPHVEEMQRCAQQQTEAARTLRKRIRRVQLDQMHRALPEMEDVIIEMNRIFSILVPTLEAFNLFDDDDDDDTQGNDRRTHATPRDEATATSQYGAAMSEDALEENETVEWEDAGNDDDDDAIQWETVPSSTEADAFEDEQHKEAGDGEDDNPLTHMDINEIVQAYGLGSASYQLTISIPTGGNGVQSHDNAVLFQHLADGTRRIHKRFLPLVHEWRAHALEYRNSSNTSERTEENNNNNDDDDEDIREREVMPRINDLQQRLDEIVAKWGELVEDHERRQLAQIPSSIVSMPLAAYTPHQQQQRDHERKRVLLQQKRPVKRARDAPL
uniref:VHS domain-containing protein n=1 Tax=Globisporangium ultimum (strain ATCC 200006 / CBS 805.95 / DAOM BR144) TaxID=431595 RepID=K3WXC1_GLOUD